MVQNTTRWTVASFLAALALALATLLATAGPVPAQSGADQYDSGGSAEEVSATGTIQPLDAGPVVIDGLQICELSTHSITDEATGQYYDLKSDTVDLGAYAGQRVTVTGTPLPSPAIGGTGAEWCPDLEVTGIASADAPEGGQPVQETVLLTFELTIDGEVSEGKNLSLSHHIADYPSVAFCTTAPELPDLPLCEDGSTYSKTLEVPTGGPFSYEYVVFDYAYGGVVEAFAADTITPTEGTTVSATYRAGTTGPPPNEPMATFSFELVVECEPPANATFFGQVPAEGTFSTPLTDPDGDGLYTGSITVPPVPPGAQAGAAGYGAGIFAGTDNAGGGDGGTRRQPSRLAGPRDKGFRGGQRPGQVLRGWRLLL